MYTAFYGLREKPFALTPDPRFLFLAAAHREALAHLLYGIEESEGFIAITGEVGTGKTTLCRTLLARLGAETEVAFLFNPSPSGIELLEAIASEFGLPAAGRSLTELGADLNHFLLEKRREGKRVLLIVDEAQNLDDATLEQVRLISNLETSTEKLIQILLLGQPELDRKLDSDTLRQLRQRISVRWHLVPLTRRETAAYVEHRLRIAAGGARKLFTDGALTEIHRRTGGIPRLVNVLCDRCLLAGYASDEERIGRRRVAEVAREIPDASGARRGLRSAARRRRWAVAAALVALVAGGSVGLAAFQLDVPRTRFLRLLSANVSSRLAGAPPSEPAPTVRGAAGDIEQVALDAARSNAPPAVSSSPPLGASALVPRPVPGAVEVPAPVGEVVIAPPWRAASAASIGEHLAVLLDAEPAAEGRLRAVNHLLSAYGLPSIGIAPPSTDAALARLGEHGLQVLPLEATDLEMVRSLNHPALLSLKSRSGEQRLVALTALDGGLGEIVGAGGEEAASILLHRSEIEARWAGRAFIVWRRFEPIGDVLTAGDDGPAIGWLQRALSELGYFTDDQPPVAAFVFDSGTLAGVKELQWVRGLEPDGAVGPRTQMVLFDLLGRYEVPVLDRGQRLEAVVAGASLAEGSLQADGSLLADGSSLAEGSREAKRLDKAERVSEYATEQPPDGVQEGEDQVGDSAAGPSRGGAG